MASYDPFAELFESGTATEQPPSYDPFAQFAVDEEEEETVEKKSPYDPFAEFAQKDEGYGKRADGTEKGTGFLGELPMQDDTGRVSTEISIGVEFDGKETQIPTLVPTLNDEQKAYLLGGGDPRQREDIVRLAEDHAKSRMKEGKPVFAGADDVVQPPLVTQSYDPFAEFSSNEPFITDNQPAGPTFRTSKSTVQQAPPEIVHSLYGSAIYNEKSTIANAAKTLASAGEELAQGLGQGLHGQYGATAKANAISRLSSNVKTPLEARARQVREIDDHLNRIENGLEPNNPIYQEYTTPDTIELLKNRRDEAAAWMEEKYGLTGDQTNTAKKIQDFTMKNIDEKLKDDFMWQLGEKHLEYSDFWRELKEERKKSWDIDPEFANSTMGQFIRSAGMAPGYLAMAAMGPLGIGMMQSSMYAFTEDDARQAVEGRGEEFKPEEHILTLSASAAGQALLERAFGFERIANDVLKNIGRFGKMSFKDFAKKVAIQSQISGLEEAATEPTQGAWEDFIASISYDEGRKVLTGDALKRRFVEALSGYSLGLMMGGGVTTTGYAPMVEAGYMEPMGILNAGKEKGPDLEFAGYYRDPETGEPVAAADGELVPLFKLKSTLPEEGITKEGEILSLQELAQTEYEFIIPQIPEVDFKKEAELNEKEKEFAGRIKELFDVTQSNTELLDSLDFDKREEEAATFVDPNETEPEVNRLTPLRERPEYKILDPLKRPSPLNFTDPTEQEAAEAIDKMIAESIHTMQQEHKDYVLKKNPEATPVTWEFSEAEVRLLENELKRRMNEVEAGEEASPSLRRDAGQVQPTPGVVVPEGAPQARYNYTKDGIEMWDIINPNGYRKYTEEEATISRQTLESWGYKLPPAPKGKTQFTQIDFVDLTEAEAMAAVDKVIAEMAPKIRTDSQAPQQTGQKVSKPTDEAIENAAATQRGHPETTMNRVVRSLGKNDITGTITHLLEHLGDLSHRAQRKNALGNVDEKLSTVERMQGEGRMSLAEEVESGVRESAIFRITKSIPELSQMDARDAYSAAKKRTADVEAEIKKIRNELLEAIPQYVESHRIHNQPVTVLGDLGKQVAMAYGNDLIQYAKTGNANFDSTNNLVGKMRDELSAIDNDVNRFNAPATDAYVSDTVGLSESDIKLLENHIRERLRIEAEEKSEAWKKLTPQQKKIERLKRQLEKEKTGYEERYEAAKKNFNAKIDKNQKNFDARMEQAVEKYNARIQKAKDDSKERLVKAREQMKDAIAKREENIVALKLKHEQRIEREKVRAATKLANETKKRIKIIQKKGQERANVETAIADLEALVKELPFNIQGKFRGYKTLVQKKGEETQQKYLNRASERLDKIMDDYTIQQNRGAIDKLLRRVLKNRKKPKEYAIFDTIKRYAEMPLVDALNKAEAITNPPENADGTIPQVTPEQREDAFLLQIFGGKLNSDNSKDFDGEQMRLARQEAEYILNEGRSRVKDRIAIQEQHRQMLLEKFEGILMKGEEILGDNFLKDIEDTKKTVKKVLRDMDRYANRKQDSLEMLIDSLDTTEGRFSGWLHDTFSSRVFDARIKANRRNSLAINKLGSVMERVLQLNGVRGGKKAMLDTAQAWEVTSKDHGIKYNHQGTTDKIVPLNKWQGITMWMQWHDKTLAPSFEKMGINDETIKKVETFIGDDGKMVGTFLLNEYKKYGQELRQVVADNDNYIIEILDNYSPIIRYVEGKVDEGSLETLNMKDFRGHSVTNRSMIMRTKNTNELHFKGANDIFKQHVYQMNHYFEFAAVANDINTVFRNQKMRRAIRQRTGGNEMNVLLDDMIGDILNNGMRRAQIDDMVAKFVRGTTVGSLALRVPVFFKQLGSAPAYMNDMPVGEWFAYEKEFWKHPIKNAQTLIDLPYIQDRISNSYDRELRQIAQQGTNRGIADIRTRRDQWMFLTRYGDLGAILVGGWPLYQYTYDQTYAKAEADKKSPEEADRLAKKEAARRFSETTARQQQDSNIFSLGYYQRGPGVQKMFTQYMTTPIQYHRNVANAIRAWSTKDAEGRRRITTGQMAKTVFIFHVLMPQIYTAIGSAFIGMWGDDDDAVNEFWRRQGNALLIGNLNSLFIVGDFIEGFIATLGNKDQSWLLDTNIPALQVVEDGLKGLSQALNAEDSGEYWDGVNEVLENVFRGYGIPYGQVMDFFKAAEEVGEGEAEYPLLRLMGWSDYQIPGEEEQD